MNLRKLEKKDAPFMLEWMHDNNVTIGFQRNFGEKTIADCEEFIKASQDIGNDIHMAVTDDNDEYMGTVSLKNIRTGLPISCGMRFPVSDLSGVVIHCAHDRTAFKAAYTNKISCSMFADSLEVV